MVQHASTGGRRADSITTPRVGISTPIRMARSLPDAVVFQGMLLIVLLAMALAFFIVLVELRVLSYAYQKIGVRPRYVFLILVLTLIGSHVNVPLYSVPAGHVVTPQPNWRYERSYAMPRIAQTGRSIVA